MATPSPTSIPISLPPGPNGPGPLVLLAVLAAVSGYLWWRVRREVRRPRREEPDDVA